MVYYFNNLFKFKVLNKNIYTINLLTYNFMRNFLIAFFILSNYFKFFFF